MCEGALTAEATYSSWVVIRTACSRFADAGLELLEMNEAIVPAPAAGDGLVFVVTTQGRLYALR